MSDFLGGTKTQDMHTDVNFKLSKGVYEVSKVFKKYLIQKQLFMVKNKPESLNEQVTNKELHASGKNSNKVFWRKVMSKYQYLSLVRDWDMDSRRS